MRKVLKNESFSGALANIAGMMVGVVNTMWLLPLIFSLEQIGFYRWLERSAMVLSQILLIGTHRVYIKYYTKLDELERNALMNQIFSILFGISAVLLMLLFGASDWLASFMNIEAFQRDIWLLGVLTPALMFFIMGSSTASVKGAIRIPFLWRSLGLRLILLASGFLVVLNYAQFRSWVVLQVVASVIVGVGVLWWSLKLVNWHPISTFIYKGVYRQEMRLFGLFNSFNSFLTFTLNTLDVQFILIFLGPSQLGVYSIASFIALFIDGIKRPLSQSAIPNFSKYWNESDYSGLSRYYKRTSLVLTIVAVGAFLMIVPNMAFLVSFIPDSGRFNGVVPLVELLLLARIIDYSLGYNGEILANGPEYKLNLYLSGIMLVVLVVANYFLIDRFGIIGAPLAFLLVNSLFNAFKALYLYRRRGWSPFSKNQLAIIALGVLFFLPTYWLDEMNLRHLLLRVGMGGIWAILAWYLSKKTLLAPLE